jgi:hypothetical protein
MTKKLRIEEKAGRSDLRSDQVRILICKSVVVSRACTLERYFLGNGATIASAVLKVLASRRRRMKGFLRKERLAHARRREKLAQRQAQERIFYAVMISMNALNFCSSSRSLWTKERCSYRWEHIVNHTFSACDWLENF